MENLNAKQRALNLKEHALIQSVQTRWNSTEAMLACLLEQKAAVSATLLESKKTEVRALNLSARDLTRIDALVHVLTPMKVATEQFCGQVYPSLSMVEPIVQALVHKFLKVSEDDTSFIADLKESMRNGLKKRFGDEGGKRHRLMCSLLDPQFKDLKFVTEEERKKTHEHMLDAMEGITLESLDGTAAKTHQRGQRMNHHERSQKSISSTSR